MRKAFLVGILTIAAATAVSAFAQNVTQRGKSRAAAGAPYVAKGAPQPLPAQAERLMVPYRGTKVVAQPDAKGDELRLQRDLASMLQRIDYIPQYRINYFQNFAQKAGQPITGWKLSIKEISPDVDGYLVRVEVMPYWFYGGFSSSICSTEMYHFAKGKFDFQGYTLPQDGLPIISSLN